MTIYRPRWPIDEAFTVSPDVWTALLRVDPLGWPIDYVASSMDARLGATLSGGSFTMTFEDDEFNLKNRFTDLEHVWIGVQKGDDITPWDGVSGRAWLLGGWIQKRSTKIDKRARKIFTVEGFDYMTLMPYLIFATPENKKEYNNADLGMVSKDIMTLLHTYDFDPAPGLDFVEGPAELVGTKILKTYEKYNIVSDVLKDLSELASPLYDWYIRPSWTFPATYQMLVYFHERRRRPSVMTIDWTNLRGGSEFDWGDAKEVVTNVLVTDGESQSVPPDKMQWTTQYADWQFVNESYVCDFLDWVVETKAGLSPLGRQYLYSNVSNAWGVHAQGLFVQGVELYMRYPLTWDLALDLRRTSHITFDFRKDAKRVGDKYYLTLHSAGGYITYDFTSLRTVGNNEWQLHAIELPVVNYDGIITDWKGWQLTVAPFDPTNLRYLQFIFDPASTQLIGHLAIARLFFDRANYQEASSGLFWPPRTIAIIDKDIDTAQEARNRAEYELSLRMSGKQYIVPVVDGDPRYLPGEGVRVNLAAPFWAIDLVVNEAVHTLNEELSYECKLTLSHVAQRASSIVPGTATKFRMIEGFLRTTMFGKVVINEPKT